MGERPVGMLVARGAGTLLLATLAWAVLGFLATAPLGLAFGWSGHPSIPNAPLAVYVGLYLVVLPLACIAGAWKAVGWLISRLND